MEHLAESLESLRSRIAASDAVLVSFNEPSCRVGAAVEEKVVPLLAAEFPRLDVVHVDAASLPDAARAFGVIAVPTLLVCFAGKESSRFVRTFGTDEVRRAIARPYSIMFDSP